MASSVTLPRTLLIYAITIPLALVLGYLLISPTENTSLLALLFVAFVLCLPVLLRAHHTVLLFSWNAMICVFFVPGQPYIWMLMTVLTLGIVILNHIINRDQMFVAVPSVTKTLLFLGAVVLLTAKLRGGVGIRAFGGDSYGGKAYIFILLGIAGYFALTSTVIPLERIPKTIGLFFLSGVTAIVGHLVLLVGPGLYFLFRFFPSGVAQTQYTSELSGGGIVRYAGVTLSGIALINYLLARYGIRGIFNTNHPFRILSFVLALACIPLGGFRSNLMFIIMVLVVQFVCEGLLRTKFLPLSLGAVVLLTALLTPFSKSLPLTMQRAVSFLPVEVDAAVAFDAEASTTWRLEMWKLLMPELPKRVILGKGYSLDPTHLYMVQQGIIKGFGGSYEGSLASGDYHNGPLSVYIPLGGLGALAFVLFLVASTRVLYRNYRHGRAELRQVNTLLFATHVTHMIFFTFVFGSFHVEFYQFIGPLGLSVSFNGGVASPSSPENRTGQGLRDSFSRRSGVGRIEVPIRVAPEQSPPVV